MKVVHTIETLLGLAPTCKKVTDFLADYVEGTLPESVSRKFEKHIGMCSCCGHYFDQYRATIDLIKEGTEVKIPEELVEHTMTFLRTNVNLSR